MIELFKQILYIPLFNAVIWLYNVIPGNDFGLAIIALTLIVRLILLPISIKGIKSQKALNSINPKIKEIREKYKTDMNTQSTEILKLYRENGISPLSGCLPLLIQIPILISLYRVFINSFKPESLHLLYSFVSVPQEINRIAFGFIDLAVSNPVLVIISGVGQFFQMRASVSRGQSGNKQLDAMNRQMLYFFPVMIIIIGWNLPAGLLIYWITTTAVSLFEQTYIKSRY